jgi:hypothetical protein
MSAYPPWAKSSAERDFEDHFPDDEWIPEADIEEASDWAEDRWSRYFLGWDDAE